MVEEERFGKKNLNKQRNREELNSNDKLLFFNT